MVISKLFVMHFGHLSFILLTFLRMLWVFQPVSKNLHALTYDRELNLLSIPFSVIHFFPQGIVEKLGFKGNKFSMVNCAKWKLSLVVTKTYGCQKMGKINDNLILDELFTTFRKCQFYFIMIIIFILLFLYVLGGCFTAFCDLSPVSWGAWLWRPQRLGHLCILQGENCDPGFLFSSFCFLPVLPLGKQMLQTWSSLFSG